MIKYPSRNIIDASILDYKHSPERTGFNLCGENTQQKLTFLALIPCLQVCRSPNQPNI